MKISDSVKSSLKLAHTANFVNDELYLKLLQNCFSVLKGNSELHSLTSLYNSKPDVIKELYAALLTACAEFARNDSNRDSIVSFLTSECSFPPNRAKTLFDQYETNRQEVQIRLGEIGSHAPHITDVEWKIDYIIKSSVADQLSGPIFRVSFVAEVYDEQEGKKRVERVNFSCTSQELQDLVYKLRDAVRHVQKLASEH